MNYFLHFIISIVFQIRNIPEIVFKSFILVQGLKDHLSVESYFQTGIKTEGKT